MRKPRVRRGRAAGAVRKRRPVRRRQTPRRAVVAGRSYAAGYRDGVRDGGEQLLERHMPLHVLIPNLTPEAAMAAGIGALSAGGYPILFPPEVHAELAAALQEGRPYAFVRLGDGELLTLAQERVLSDAEIRQVGPFLPYAGVKIPDRHARDLLVDAVRTAALIGVPMSRRPYFQPLLMRVLRAYEIEPAHLKLTTSTMNYSLHDHGLLLPLLAGRRVLVIGNTAGPLAGTLVKHGIPIAGTIAPVRGIADVPRILASAAPVEFDIALVAAGIAAVPICAQLAATKGKVAIDLGHLANKLAGLATPY